MSCEISIGISEDRDAVSEPLIGRILPDHLEKLLVVNAAAPVLVNHYPHLAKVWKLHAEALPSAKQVCERDRTADKISIRHTGIFATSEPPTGQNLWRNDAKLAERQF